MKGFFIPEFRIGHIYEEGMRSKIDNRMMLIALNETPGIGIKTIALLHQQLDELTILQTCTQKELTGLGLTGKQASSFLTVLNKGILDKRLALYEKQGIRILTIADPEYPPILKEIYQPPWVLYAIGDLSILDLPLIGIVGTRKPTPYGKKVTEHLAGSLVQRGAGIVSGMARGIDSFAHQGALQENGKTVAVLGGPVDTIYPPENDKLYRKITESGLVLSEVPGGTSIHPGCFPLRNRIISGISLGIVVVEAAEQSGSLITVDRAIEQGKDVFAVPGPIYSTQSKGTLHLIKDGCKMVTGVEDILEEYSHTPDLFTDYLEEGKPSNIESKLKADEDLIYSLLSDEPKSVDWLCQQSKFKFGHLYSVLLSLLMKNKIAQLPGSVYVRI